jgi:outer membrane protein assembly factor BamB
MDIFPQIQPNSFSHPAVGADGTIYVGGYDKFYVINPDGTEK